MRDPQIRAALVQRLRASHPDLSQNVIREEMGVGLGASRVDVGLLNGHITGYEIKSSSDNLDRLPGQVEHYSRCLDQAVIVTTERRAESIEGHVPTWWGVLVAIAVDSEVTFREQRPPTANPDVQAFYVAQLLWRDEAYAELASRGLHGDLRRATRWALWDRLAELPIDELRDSVRERLKGRHAI
jgi:hypothetical protein